MRSARRWSAGLRCRKHQRGGRECLPAPSPKGEIGEPPVARRHVVLAGCRKREQDTLDCLKDGVSRQVLSMNEYRLNALALGKRDEGRTRDAGSAMDGRADLRNRHSHVRCGHRGLLANAVLKRCGRRIPLFFATLRHTPTRSFSLVPLRSALSPSTILERRVEWSETCGVNSPSHQRMAPPRQLPSRSPTSLR